MSIKLFADEYNLVVGLPISWRCPTLVMIPVLGFGDFSRSGAERDQRFSPGDEGFGWVVIIAPRSR